MSAPVVFLGPSGFGIDPLHLAGFDVRPPAGCGDILSAVRRGCRVVGLVDGVFETTRTVWHKEILFALSEGISVFGAASMGALRAAECAAFGMRGVGAIFASYASGERAADADVAVAHAPAELGFRPLSLALVDAEATLEECLAGGAMDSATAEGLLSSARALHFKQRTWRRTIAKAGLSGESAKLAHDAVVRHWRSLKQEDTLLLLDAVREPRKEPAKAFERFNRTRLFDALDRGLSKAGAGG